MTREEELRLLRRVQSGEAEAFEELVRAHEKTVYNLALRMLGDPQDAEDISQEAFLKAVMYHDSFKPELSKKPQDFGNRIAENCKRDAFQRVGRHKDRFTALVVTDSEGEETVPIRVASYRGDEFETDRDILSEEFEDRLSRAIDTLCEPYQRLVTMSLDGYKTGEIAKQLGLDPENTYTRLCRAKAALRKALGTDFKDDFDLCA